MQTLILPASLDVLGAIGHYVMEAASAANLDKKAAYRLRLAVDEIATNAIVHGHAGAAHTGALHVQAMLTEPSLTITLEDTGMPFDPRQAPPPENLGAPLEERRIGGLGLYLTIQGVDEFHYERIGERNQHTFVMHRSTAAAQE